jgi:3-oxoacyl-[acyl-carrier-protein] synthase-3
MSLPESLAGERIQGRGTPRANAVGLGCALPEFAVGNALIAAAIGVDEAWIERRTGIRSRRHAPAEMTLLDLAADSALAALDDAGIDAVDVDLLILATVSQERRVPNLAPELATSIGAVSAGAFDLGAACSGFVAGLAIASAFIETARARHVLLVGADMLSRHIDPYDRRTAAIFGDGAGAVLLSAGESGGVSEVELGADGSCAELIASDPESDVIRMDGPETFKVAVRTMEEGVRSLCARAAIDPLCDVDLFVFHQANGRITRAVAERLDLPDEKVVDCIAEVGNTSAASVPLALEQARTDGRLQSGSRVLLSAVGAGFTSAAALLEWGSS